MWTDILHELVLDNYWSVTSNFLHTLKSMDKCPSFKKMILHAFPIKGNAGDLEKRLKFSSPLMAAFF